MSASVNKVLLIGNLGKDPDIRRSQSGELIASFRLATSETWKDKNTGERKENVQWHSVVVFNNQIAEVVEKYLKKGSKVCVEGALQTRKWTDDRGIDRYVTEVVLQRFRGALTLLDSKNSSGAYPPQADPDDYGTTTTRSASPTGNPPTSMKDTLPDDYDIPF